MVLRKEKCDYGKTVYTLWNLSLGSYKASCVLRRVDIMKFMNSNGQFVNIFCLSSFNHMNHNPQDLRLMWVSLIGVGGSAGVL